MQTRTIRDFPVQWDVFPLVEDWAQRNGYRRQPSTATTRQYKRGMTLWTAPMMLAVSQNGEHVHLEAWVQISSFFRALAPAEIALESGGGSVAVVPREVAREKVNHLLAQLGQPPIT